MDLFLPTYKLTKLITESTQTFPKCYKSTLGDSLVNNMLECVKLLVKYNYGKDNIQEIKETICYVSLTLRICVDLKIISIGRFAEITLLIDEIKELLKDPEDTVLLK